MNLSLRQRKMLERVRDGLDTDANLTGAEKHITHFLWVNGLIEAVPVEGSDCQQDALFITDRGRAALELETQEVERARAIADRLVHTIESDTDVLVMKADLLKRNLEA